MRNIKKVAVAVDMKMGLSKSLDQIKRLSFLRETEIHLVHVYRTIDPGYTFEISQLALPGTPEREAITQAIVARLARLKEEILPPDLQCKVVMKCLFSETLKEKFSEYVANEHIDLVIMAAREKRGMFESSFTNYMCRHLPASVLVLKP